MTVDGHTNLFDCKYSLFTTKLTREVDGEIRHCERRIFPAAGWWGGLPCLRDGGFTILTVAGGSRLNGIQWPLAIGVQRSTN